MTNKILIDRGLLERVQDKSRIKVLREEREEVYSQLAASRQQIERLVEALQFYADGNHFNYKDGDSTAYACEFGTTAAKALAAVENERGNFEVTGAAPGKG